MNARGLNLLSCGPLLAALAFLTLVGCDGWPGQQDAVVKVGILHSQTGPMAESERPLIDATLMAIEQINQDRLLPGIRLEAVIRDGASDPATFARRAQQMIREDQVVAIFGGWTSASRKALKGVVEQHQHLLFYPLQYEGIESSPNLVYLGSTPNQQIIPAVSWAIHNQGHRRFFLIGSDYVFPRVAHTIIRDQIKALGAEVVGEVFLPLGSEQVEEAIRAIQETQPSMILNTLNGRTNVPFFRGLRAVGITPERIPSLSFSIGENEVRRIGNRNMAGDYACWHYFQSLDNPANHAWTHYLHEQLSPELVLNDPMEAAHVGVNLWAQAVLTAAGGKTVTVADCQPDRVLAHLNNQTFEGPGGRVYIHPETRHLYKIARVGRILPDGQFQVVWSSDVPVRPEPYPVFRSPGEWEALLSQLNRAWGGTWSAPAATP